MPALAQTRRFNVDAYYKMAEAGILEPDDRVELIEGEIIEMSPIGSRHAACVRRLNRLLSSLSGENALLSVQDPIRLDDLSEPEPDVALLRPRDDFYVDGHPTPDDVLLLIEVGDSSLLFDRTVKLPLYARAGIREVWMVNLIEDYLESHREPVDGEYRVVRRYRVGDRVAPQEPEGIEIEVATVFGR